MSKPIKYDVISSIVSLINAEQYESTILNLAKDCHLPIPYVRKIIIALLNNQVMFSCIDTWNDNDADEELSLIEQYIEKPDDIKEKILNGDMDNINWTISFNILDNNEQELLPLTHLEYGTLKSLGENVLSLKSQSPFEKKDTVTPLTKEIRDNQLKILEAIAAGKQVLFRYQKSNGQRKQVKCFPVDLFTNVSDNWIYMRSAEGKCYRLDRFISVCHKIENSAPFPEYNADPKQKYVWGSFSNSDMEPVHVKIKIFPETKNIITKIQNDIRYRQETCQFYKKGDCFYYEDDIIGIPEFQRWIRGYGSSIVVLVPESLKNEIVSRAHEMLGYYQKVNLWKDL